MAATSFAVPSAEEMRTILCVSCSSDWLLMLSRDSRLGAIGRAAWATCSWVRRIARDAGMTPAEWAAGAAGAEGLAAELWCALGSDACRHRKGRIEASRLEYAQGGGHQHWLKSLRGACGGWR